MKVRSYRMERDHSSIIEIEIDDRDLVFHGNGEDVICLLVSEFRKALTEIAKTSSTVEITHNRRLTIIGAKDGKEEVWGVPGP